MSNFKELKNQLTSLENRIIAGKLVEERRKEKRIKQAEKANRQYERDREIVRENWDVYKEEIFAIFTQLNTEVFNGKGSVCRKQEKLESHEHWDWDNGQERDICTTYRVILDSVIFNAGEIQIKAFKTKEIEEYYYRDDNNKRESYTPSYSDWHDHFCLHFGKGEVCSLCGRNYFSLSGDLKEHKNSHLENIKKIIPKEILRLREENLKNER